MTRYALIATLFLALPLLAGEDDKRDRRAAVIAKKDADGDGRLNAAEFGGGREIFDLLDRNGDGFLTADEFPEPPARRPRRDDEGKRPGPPRGPSAERLLRTHDRDGDGKLSAEEWPEVARLKFEQVDKNADGSIDLHELGQIAERRRRPRQGPEGQRPDAEQIRKAAGGLMKRLDKNGDGRLTPDEFPEKAGRLDLTKADRNQDGVVDLLELTAALHERMGRDRQRGGAQQFVRRMQQWDENGDGVIEREEWKGSEPLFARLDADQDGKISQKEARKFAEEAGRRWNNRVSDAAFNRFDENGDGKIAAEEWKSRPELFARFDVNGDGFITRGELTPKGPRGGRRAKMYDARSGKDSAAFLAKFDKNRDGKVSKEECPHERRFAEIDADGDGTLSETEIKDAMDKRQREEAYDLFERLDLNRDGKITREEFTGPAAAFERLDRNNDGVIDKADAPEK
ncbi:MAG: EF-hand domain-containing protein [Planctomycetota bacterium]|jgi:Ca2+-binding EF-hand superfamily protein